MYARDETPCCASSQMCQSWRFVRSQNATASSGRVPHCVVGEQGEEQVREDRVVVDAAAVVLGQRAHRLRARGLPAEREALPRRLDRHVAAEDRALGEIVRPAAVMGEPCQLGMDARAVVALREVLEEELPVGVDVVLDPSEGAQLAEPPGRELPGQRSEGRRERRQDRMVDHRVFIDRCCVLKVKRRPKR